MKIQVAKLKDGENQFSFDSASSGWLQAVVDHLSSHGYVFTGSIRVDLSLTKLEPDYYLRGRLDSNVDRICARCSEGFGLPISYRFEFGLVHVTKPGAKAGSKLAQVEKEEDLDVTYFEGGEIDLSPIIEEQFYLSLPYRVLCNENCKGMCQQCGKNLNNSPCECKKPETNHPFTVLKDYKV